MSARANQPKESGTKTAESRAMIALALASASSSASTPEVKLMFKPAKKVVAEKAFKIGSLVLAPESLSVSSTTTGKVPSSAVVVAPPSECLSFATYYLTMPTMTHEPENNTILSPFWMVRQSSDPNEVNMQLFLKKVDITVKMRGAAGDGVSRTVAIPMLRNSRNIGEGEELVRLLEGKPEKGGEAAASGDAADQQDQQDPQAKRQRRVKAAEK